MDSVFSFKTTDWKMEPNQEETISWFRSFVSCLIQKKKDRPGITILYYTESIGSGLNNDSLIKAICILTLSLFKSR